MIPFFHRWVSQRALQQAGYAPHVVSAVSEMSRWIDWYAWDEPAANATTPTDVNGLPLDSDAAQQAATQRLRGFVNNAIERAGSERYLWLGCALHLVEDLASHQGRTDPEHTFQMFLLVPNPDWSPAGIRRGLRYARLLLHALETRLGNAAESFRCEPGARILTPAETAALLGPRNFSLPALWEVLRSARFYWRTPRHRRRIRWNTDRVLRDAFKIKNGVGT